MTSCRSELNCGTGRKSREHGRGGWSRRRPLFPFAPVCREDSPSFGTWQLHLQAASSIGHLFSSTSSALSSMQY